jgi:hypothetical protein
MYYSEQGCSIGLMERRYNVSNDIIVGARRKRAISIGETGD